MYSLSLSLLSIWPGWLKYFCSCGGDLVIHACGVDCCHASVHTAGTQEMKHETVEVCIQPGFQRVSQYQHCIETGSAECQETQSWWFRGSKHSHSLRHSFMQKPIHPSFGLVKNVLDG